MSLENPFSAPAPKSPDNAPVIEEDKLEELPIGDSSRIDLALAIEGLKRATDIQIPYADDESAESIQVKIQEAEEFFKENELQFVANQRKDIQDLNWKEYIVGKNKEDVLAFQQAWNLPETLVVKDRIGTLSGFPQTSVDAYTDKNALIAEAEIPEIIRNQEYMAFCSFKFSKANWQDEIETVKKWAEAIKNRHPKIYERRVKEYKELGE